MGELESARHLAISLSSTQLESLAAMLDSSDWTSEVRAQLRDALLDAGRPAEADHLADPYSDSTR